MTDFLLDVPEPLLPRPLLCLLLKKDGPIAFFVPTMPLLITVLSGGGGGGLVRIMLPGVASFSFSFRFSTRVRCCSSQVTGFWPFRACRVSWGRCICLVSFSNFFNKCWLVMRSASTSSMLTCTVSNVPPGGRLSTSPG